jgi:hypothetical protein
MERPFSLGVDDAGEEISAEHVYETLAIHRESVNDRAREMAEITIPSVFPPEGYVAGDEVAGNNQSITALCVNNLASLLMFLAFPPGHPMAVFEPIEHKLHKEIQRDPQLWSRIQLALARLEVEHRKKIKVSNVPVTYVEFMKLLIIAGNGLWKQTKASAASIHTSEHYVVKRNEVGEVLLTILKKCVAFVDLDKDVQDLVLESDPEMAKTPLWEREVDIYCVCKLRKNGSDKEDNWHWEYWEEYAGNIIPDTDYEADYDNPPQYAAWMIPMYGQDWGRSYCEEYRGDLYSVENFMSSINDGAAAASLLMWFVKPGSRTTVRQIKEAENLSVHWGAAEDVTALTLGKDGKLADFNFVSSTLEQAARRLSRAFLLNESVRRDAERVTAEEIKRLSVDLDRAMGGVYTQTSTTTQRYVVQRNIYLHREEDKELPVPPEGIIRLSLLTGMDALGRSMDETALQEFAGALKEAFGPEPAAKALNLQDYARRLAAAKGIQPEGLVKGEEQLASEAQQEQQAAMMQRAVDKGTGPAVQAMGKSLPDMMQKAQEQQQQGA